jgi:hypothetical protein
VTRQANDDVTADVVTADNRYIKIDSYYLRCCCCLSELWYCIHRSTITVCIVSNAMSCYELHQLLSMLGCASNRASPGTTAAAAAAAESAAGTAAANNNTSSSTNSSSRCGTYSYTAEPGWPSVSLVDAGVTALLATDSSSDVSSDVSSSTSDAPKAVGQAVDTWSLQPTLRCPVFASRGRRLTLRACGWLCATDDAGSSSGSSASSGGATTAATAGATASVGASTSEQQLSSERGSGARKFISAAISVTTCCCKLHYELQLVL